MNLIKDPWIPVAMQDGTSTLLSLIDTYRQAESIKHIGTNAATSLSLYRLLLCITQRALDGPEDVSSWKKCMSSIINKSVKYLKQQVENFELQGRFLQLEGLSDSAKASPVSRLAYFTPSGSSHTLFDSYARMGIDQCDDATIALGLLCTQVMAIGGGDGRGDSGMRWGGKKIKEGRQASAISGALLTMVLGEDLLHTIWNNLITKDDLEGLKIPFGVPVWEGMPKTQPSNCNKSFLYNMVPLSRALRIEGSIVHWNDGVSPCMVDVYRDPYTTGYKGKKGTVLVKVDPNKELWRNLSSILYQKEGLCPLPITRMNSMGIDKDITIYSGGMSTDKAEKIAAIHWQLNVPSRLLIDAFSMEKYRAKVVYAEIVALRFRDASKIYMGSSRNSGYKCIISRATIEYWQRMESHSHELLNALRVNGNTDWWNDKVISEALTSFEHACGRINSSDLANFIKAEQVIRGGK